MTLKPLADKVVVKRLEAEEKTKSGLLLAAGSQEKPEIYEVVAVGPGGVIDGNEIKMEVKVGDRILTGKYTGTTVKIEGEEYTVVRQNDILAILED